MPEIPGLAELWFGAGRADLVDSWRRRLVTRTESDHVRLTVDLEHWDVVARTIVETCVLWAVHLHWDRAPLDFRTTHPDVEVAGVLASLFTSGLVPHGPMGWPLGHLWVRETAAINDQTITLLEPSPEEHVLELGCGPGLMAAEVARRGAHVTCLDPSPVMIAAARRRNRGANEAGTVRVLIGDAAQVRAAQFHACPRRHGPLTARASAVRPSPR